MRHVLRTYRVNLDWLLDKNNLNANIHQQIADNPTEGSFTRDKKNGLVNLFGMVPESFDRSPFSVVAAFFYTEN